MPRVSKVPEERRLELMDAAEALFLTRGYDKTSVSDIVKAVGVAQGTFYYHFSSKLSVLEAIVERELEELEDDLQGIVSSPETGPADQLRALLTAVFRLMDEHDELIVEVHNESNVALHHNLMSATAAVILPRLTRVIARGTDRGDFHVDAPAETADMIVGMMMVLVEDPDLRANPPQHMRRREAFRSAVRGVLRLPDPT